MRNEHCQVQKLSVQWPLGHLSSFRAASRRFCITFPGCTMGLEVLWLSLVGRAQHSESGDLDLASVGFQQHCITSLCTLLGSLGLGLVICKTGTWGYYRI